MIKKPLFLKIFSVLTVLLFIIIVLVLIFYNLKNNVDFFKTPLSTIISLVIAIIVSYYFVQKKTDDRRKKEKIDRLLYKIQDLIADEAFLSVESDEIIRKNHILHRSVGNKLKYVNENVDGLFANEMKKISETFEEMREFYGNHYNDPDYVNKSVKEITNFKSIIDDNCDKIHMELI
ncbi:hypothetical protein [Lacrimispora sp.]|uniref:hypothetical protein n=1 Tax=Lacrimispora sp. TaxID=2719234 RepID=UPI0028AB56B3|nr:hypothetical protein [Lacrimispora sp.]